MHIVLELFGWRCEAASAFRKLEKGSADDTPRDGEFEETPPYDPHSSAHSASTERAMGQEDRTDPLGTQLQVTASKPSFGFARGDNGS